MRPLICAGLVLCLSTLLTGAPSQQTDQRPTLSVETRLVMLPVTVVDRRGAFVPGLTRDEFTVYDNGVLQAIQFFSSEDIPATVGLVIDSSSSMRGQRQDVTAAATAFAESSHPLDELFTINFNEVVWTGLPARVAFAENVEQLRTALARAPARGMTALYDAVDRALDHLDLGTRDRRALIIVGDGGDNASTCSFDDVLEHARRTNTTIYTVVLADPDDHDARPGVLKKLAAETGGAAFTPRRVEDVIGAFTRIAQEIRTGYTIGFSPADANGNGFHALRVVVNTGNGSPPNVRTRAGYYAGR